MNIPVLTLDEETHTYRHAGRVVPGVTSLLKPVDMLEGIPEELLARAAHFGRHVHKAVDLFNHNSLDWETLDPALLPYVTAWGNFLVVSGATVIESERFVYHRTLGYAGKLDAILSWPRVSPMPVLVDVKSSVAIPKSVRAQTAGYWAAYMSEPNVPELARARYCVHLLPDGKFKIQRMTDSRDWTIFLSLYNTWRWVNE